jgi:hypothetical protein
VTDTASRVILIVDAVTCSWVLERELGMTKEKVEIQKIHPEAFRDAPKSDE